MRVRQTLITARTSTVRNIVFGAEVFAYPLASCYISPGSVGRPRIVRRLGSPAAVSNCLKARVMRGPGTRTNVASTGVRNLGRHIPASSDCSQSSLASDGCTKTAIQVYIFVRPWLA